MRQIHMTTTHSAGLSITIGDQTQVWPGCAVYRINTPVYMAQCHIGWSKPLTRRIAANLHTALCNYGRMQAGYSHNTIGNGWYIAQETAPND